MTKVRVHELAKELNKTNKEVLDVLREKNIEVTSHMSSLSDEQIEAVKSSFGGGDTKEEPKKKHIVQVFQAAEFSKWFPSRQSSNTETRWTEQQSRTEKRKQSGSETEWSETK